MQIDILYTYITINGDMFLTKHKESTFQALRNGICNYNPKYTGKGMRAWTVVFQRQTFPSITC